MVASVAGVSVAVGDSDAVVDWGLGVVEDVQDASRVASNTR